MLKKILSIFSNKEPEIPAPPTHNYSSEKEYLSLALVISKVIPENTSQWNDFRPFGICCAATVTSSGDIKTWPDTSGEASLPTKMSREDVMEMVSYLVYEVGEGKTIVSWNGLGFDFRTLAEESGMYDECKELAIQHIDMMFHLVCQKGYPLALEKALAGIGRPGNILYPSDTHAAEDWSKGKYKDVLNNTIHSANAKLVLFQTTQKNACLNWLSNRNIPQRFLLYNGWLKVCEAQSMPLPDTSWMTSSWPRTDFSAWMTEPSAIPPQQKFIQPVSEISRSASSDKKTNLPELSDHQLTSLFLKYADEKSDYWNNAIGQRVNHSSWGQGTIVSLDIGKNYGTSRVTVEFDRQVETIMHGLSAIVELGLVSFDNGKVTLLDLPIEIRNTLLEWEQSIIKMEEEIRQRKEEEQERINRTQRFLANYYADFPEDDGPEYYYDEQNDIEYIDGEPV